MLDAVKLILETVAKQLSVPEMMRLRRNKKLADIGYDLFLLYIKAAEIVRNGQALLACLDYILENNPDREEGMRNLNATGSFVTYIDEQVDRVQSFLDEAQRLSNCIAVIDRGPARKLLDGAEVKLGSLYNLRRVLHDDIITYELNRMEEVGESDLGSATFLDVGDDRLLSLHAHHLPEFPWDRSSLNLMRRYSESGLARRRLDSLAETAQAFRAALQEHFDLNEVLLAAEKRGFSR